MSQKCIVLWERTLKLDAVLFMRERSVLEFNVRQALFSWAQDASNKVNEIWRVNNSSRMIPWQIMFRLHGARRGGGDEEEMRNDVILDVSCVYWQRIWQITTYICRTLLHCDMYWNQWQTVKQMRKISFVCVCVCICVGWYLCQGAQVKIVKIIWINHKRNIIYSRCFFCSLFAIRIFGRRLYKTKYGKFEGDRKKVQRTRDK